MANFNYGVEFYRRNLYALEDKQFKRRVREAEKLEKYFLEKNGNIDLIRENILISYHLNKKLTITNRLNYIRGIIYARQYIDYKDIEEFRIRLEEEFEARNLEDTLFHLKDSTNDFDYEFFSSYYKHNTYDKEEEKTEKQKQVDAIKEEIMKSLNIGENNVTTALIEPENEDNEEDEEKETVDSIEEVEVYSDCRMSCHSKILMFEDYFESYIEGLLKYKGIDNEVKTKELQMIMKGLYDWYNKMIGELKREYNNYETLAKYSSRILSLNI